MSDEKGRRRKEHEGDEPDVEAHRYVAEDPAEDDPERKRKRKHSDEPDTEDAGRRRK